MIQGCLNGLLLGAVGVQLNLEPIGALKEGLL